MTYFVVACITMFIACTISFIIHNNRSRPDNIDLAGSLILSLFASIVWWITLPAVVIIGSAWIVAKLVSMVFGRKRKENGEFDSYY